MYSRDFLYTPLPTYTYIYIYVYVYIHTRTNRALADGEELHAQLSSVQQQQQQQQAAAALHQQQQQAAYLRLEEVCAIKTPPESAP